MFTIKRLGATLFSCCSIMVATAAHADDTSADVASPTTSTADDASPAPSKADDASSTTTTAADAVRTPSAIKVANDTAMSGAFVLLSSYVMGIAVSLSADQQCQGPTCKERYLSFVPVVGGILQFATAGKSFHDQHHSDNCYPLTVADVSGQALGVVGIATGLVMRYIAHRDASRASAVEVTGSVDHGATIGLSVHFM